MKTKKNRLKLLTLAAAVLASVAGVFALQTLGSAPRAMTLQVEIDKEAAHARMTELQANIENLLKQYGQTNSQSFRAQIDAAQQEFDSISSQLGGDRPVATASGEQQIQNLGLTARQVTSATTPVGCPTTTTTFAASPNIRIPTTGTSGTRTTTINVSGLATSIWDVDAITNLTHTACGDLDITLKSPAGTIVTLTTDNAGTLNDVFNGTTWDDQANPGGQVPYSSNNGLASDHAYLNNTPATPLAPEEALGAFIGEDPNGTWTLTIHDDALGDIGNLASWSLIITTLGANTFTTQSAFPSADPNLPAVISNTCITGEVISTVNVAGMGLHTGRVKLSVDISHLNADDMDITLTSPLGTVTTITTDNGNITAPNAFSGATFDSRANLGGQVPYPNCLVIFPCNQGLTSDRVYAAAGPASLLVPEESLAAFNGEDPNGVWTLKVVDDSCNLLIGVLRSWSLDITTATCCSITCPANITQGSTAGQCGANVTFNPSDNGFCATVTCAPPSGAFFPTGTTTVNCGTSAGPGCSFTVTINDTQAPAITCPANVTAVTAKPCEINSMVTYASPAVSDNCPGVTLSCSPASGTSFPVGTTTVTCKATDTSGNMSTCSFTTTVFDVRLQDDTNPNIVILFNSFTGDYKFCCGATKYTGKGTITKRACIATLSHYTPSWRVVAGVEAGGPNKGTASIQSPPGAVKCTITDRDITNNTSLCP